MKWSNVILSSSLALGITGLFGANAVLKREYDSIDKSDKYWNYTKLSDKPFRHIKITGGNVSNIVYEQAPHTVIKVMSAWRGSEDGAVKAVVLNDTLVVDYANTYKDIYEKYWLRDAVTVRITAPAVESVSGTDTKLVFNKFDQPSLKVELQGNSRLVINSYRTDFDRFDVNQSDSSLTVLSMSNETFTNDIITIKELNATGTGVSLLNLRSSKVDQLNLNMADSASVALSGYSLGKWSEKK